MEAFGIYLLKSAVWLTGFTLVFLVFLRNERYFRLNRAYLLSGIFASVVFPFYTWHYAVMLPSLPVAEILIPDLSEPSMVTAVIPDSPGMPFYWWLYIVGIAFLAFRMIWQTARVIGKLRRNGYVKNGSVKLVRTPEYSASFSFFSFVFVNPSTSDTEMKEILNHERGHIQKRHWFDLLLVELLRIMQWFNPFAWVYAHLVRQNHEYLADEMALQRTSNPAIYRAALLNQMLGVPVISLANSFSYSLNKQRFKMMKKKIDSPFKKLKLLVVLPLIALIFYAFAKPEYIESPTPQSEKVSIEVKNESEITKVNDKTASAPITSKETVQQKAGKVKGKVTAEDGKLLQGAAIVIRGTTVGTVTDAKGKFALKDVPPDAELQISYVGLKTAQVKPDFKQTMNITLDISTVAIGTVSVGGGEPPTFKIRGIASENPPMIMLDGRIIDNIEMKKINPDDIFSISVWKDKSATEKYGEQGKNGVIVITTKSHASETSGKPFNDITVTGYAEKQKNQAEVEKEKNPAYSIVEQMPRYPGGEKVMMGFLWANTKYPPEAKAANIEGTVVVNFLVSTAGKIEKVKVIKNVNPALDAEAVRVVSSMPNWSPGKQNGKPVDVYYSIPIEFSLKSAGEKSRANPPTLKGDPEVVVVGYGTTKPISQDKSNAEPQNKMHTSIIDGEQPFVVVEQIPQDMQRQIVDGERAFVVVEQMPQFPGGENAMREFIQKTLKYPEEAKKAGIQGTVIVNFIIDKQGKIRNTHIVRGKLELIDEAIRVINSMPAWIPGKQGGKVVNVQYTIPIKFSLSSEQVIYSEVEEKPQFPGGVSEMWKFFRNNLGYPVIAQEEGAMGTALVYFVVNKNGKIENIKVLTEVHPSIKDEALRIINKMPEFLPGKKGGQAVDVACTIPFKFLLSPNPQNSQTPPTLKGDFDEVVITGLGITKPSKSVL